MAIGVGNIILVSDYNAIQAIVANVLGTGSGQSGYGQAVKSGQISSASSITASQMQDLKIDLDKISYHQNNTASTAPNVSAGQPVLGSDWTAYSTQATSLQSSKFTISNAQATETTGTNPTFTNWNGTVTHSVKVAFGSSNDARYFFNSGGEIRIKPSQTGYDNLSSKGGSWAALFANIVKFNYANWANMTSSDQQIYVATSTGSYLGNVFRVLARADASNLYLTLIFEDGASGVIDLNVDGTTTSTVSCYRATGPNVSVAEPTMTSTVTVPQPSYTITPASLTVNEGSSLRFNVGGSNISNNIYYWTINNISSSDSDFLTTNGSFTISNNTGSFDITTIADFTTEGNETFTVSVRLGSITGQPLVTTNTLTIVDTSRTASYTITPASLTVDEGSSLAFAVGGSDIINGTYYWTINNITTNNSDFSSVSGSFAVTNNSGSFAITTITDFSTEGNETFSVSIRLNSITGTVLATTNSLTIVDTSRTAIYTITPASLTVDEGSSLAFAVGGSDIINGTYYWTVNNITTNNSDFSSVSGSFAINNSSGSFAITTIADLTTEGNETFTVSVRLGSITGQPLVTTNTLTIVDTSRTASYTITPASLTIGEGSDLTINIGGSNIINGTYYWTIDNITTTNTDFSLISGSFAVTNNSGSFTITTIADLTTEGNETFTVSIRSGSINGSILKTSNVITISDTSLTPPTFTLLPLSSTVSEGSSLTFNVGGSFIINGIYYWAVDNILTSNADFSSFSGSFAISNNSGSFSLTPTADLLTEGNETFTVSIRSGSTSGNILKTSSEVTIIDTSLTPSSYTITPVSSSVNEGNNFVINITGSFIINGTYYWTINNVTTSNADFGAVSGSFSINNNSGSFSITTIADSLTEGNQTFTVSIRSGSISGNILNTSDTLTINDTSLTPPIFTLAPASSTVSEGNSMTFNVGGSNIINGTYYWAVNNLTTNNNDFAAISGSFSINNNVGSFVVATIADLTTEGNETFSVSIYSGSVGGNLLETSSTVTIIDTSITPTVYNLTPVSSTVNEGSSLGFIVDGSNITNGTYYWTVTNSGDFEISSGSFTITNNLGSFSATPKADFTTEGNEIFTASIRSNSITGNVLASTTVTIIDTSLTASYTVNPASFAVNEGSSLTVNVGGSNIVNGTYYWTINNVTTSSADFAAVNGLFTITNNVGSFLITTVADSLTEGNETFTISIRLGNINGNILATSPTVTINDTSLSVPVFVITPASTTVNEGSNLTLNISGSNIINGTYYWTVNNITTNNNDFVSTGGSFSINNNSGSFSITTIADSLTEGNETFSISIRSSSVTGNVIVTSIAITIIDTSLTPLPVYSISPASSTVNEGNSLTFNTSGSNITNGVYYWTINNITTVNADFLNSNGSFLITNNTGSFSITTIIDFATEGNETFTVSIRSGSISGDALATSSTVTIIDTSLTPSYTVTPAAFTVNEGSGLTFNVSGSNIPNGTYYWRFEGNTADGADVFLQNSSFNITNNSGAFNVTALADLTTEGSQTFAVTVRSDSSNGTILATSGLVTILDSSLSPPTYTISSPSTVNEGSSITINVGGSNITNGTFYWTVNNTTTSNADLSLTSGSFTITNNSGSFTITAISDFTTDGNETFTISIRSGSISGNPLVTSSAITIVDTSLSPVYVLTPSTSSINEGSTITFGISGSNIISGTYYWTINNVTTSNADFAAISGSVAVANNAGSFTITPTADLITEGNETFSVTLRSDSITGNPLATSSVITIVDTSRTPDPTYRFVNVATAVNEGSALTFNVTGTNVPNNTTIYWNAVNYTTDNSDFSAISGSFIMNNNSGSFNVTATADLKSEGSEQFYVTIRSDSITGSILDQTGLITINDTSLTNPSYQLGKIGTSVDEGSASSNFSIAGRDGYRIPDGTVFYWTIDTNAGDFAVSSGTVTCNNNLGQISVTPRADGITEGSETFTLSFRSGSVTGPILVSTLSYIINDTSITQPTYTVTPTLVTLRRGESKIFTLTTTNVPNNTILYWEYSSLFNADPTKRFTGSRQVTINNNTGALTINTVKDSLPNYGSETYFVAFYNAQNVNVFDYAIRINIRPDPKWNIGNSGDRVNEGGDITFYPEGSDLIDGTYYWAVNNITTTQNDFQGSTSGSFNIVEGKSEPDAFRIFITDDFVSDGGKTFTVSLLSGSVTGTTLITSNTITIVDTSVEVTATPRAFIINEESGLTINISSATGTYIRNGTYYWTINNVTTIDADFTATGGSVDILNSAGSFTITPAGDAKTEGPETFTVSIRRTSVSGPIIGTSGPITVNDTSTGVIISASPVNIYEGDPQTINVTGLFNGTYYWVIVPASTGLAAIAGDFRESSGSFTVTDNNSGSFGIFPIYNDGLAPPIEYYFVEIRTGDRTGPIVKTSEKLGLMDEAYRPKVKPASTTVNEGDTLVFTVSGDLANGTYYWTVTSAKDFETSSGSFIITSKAGTFSVTPTADFTTDGNETFTASVRRDSINGTILATSALVTMKDTSTGPGITSITGPSTINEGNTATFKITTSNAPNGSTGYFKIYGSGVGSVDDLDFDTSDPMSQGYSFILNNNTASFSVPIAKDLKTELTKSERYTVEVGITIGTGASTRVIIKTFEGTINDTSDNPTLTVTSPTTITEGSAGTFSIKSIDVPANTIVPWKITNISSDNVDFSATSGTFVVNSSGSSSFTITPILDALNEGEETFTVTVSLDTPNKFGGGTALFTTAPVKIKNADPVTVKSGSITASLNPVSEGDTVNFTITTTGYADTSLTISYVSVSNSFNTDDYSRVLVGTTSTSVPLRSGSATFSLVITADMKTEGFEEFRVKALAGSTLVAESNNISIIDSSVAPTYKLAVDPVGPAFAEGTNVKMIVTGSNIPNGDYWYDVDALSSGTTVTSGDFYGGIQDGSFTIKDNRGEFYLNQIFSDNKNENEEKFTVAVRKTSGSSITLVKGTFSIAANTT